MLKRLSYFTGVSEAFLQAHKLRFGEVDFLLQLCPGSVVSAYDSRLLFRPDHGEKYSGNTFSAVKILEPDMKQDLFLSAVGPVFDEAFRTYADTELCPPEGRETAADILSIERQWDFCGYGKDTLSLPVELMSRRPALRMMFVNGYYDLMSTFDFMFPATIAVALITGFQVSTTIFASGLATIAFAFITGKKLPLYYGSSFAYLSAISGLVAAQGYATSNGILPTDAIRIAQFGIVASGLVSIAAGLLVRFAGRDAVEKVLPPSITGPVAMAS